MLGEEHLIDSGMTTEINTVRGRSMWGWACRKRDGDGFIKLNVSRDLSPLDGHVRAREQALFALYHAPSIHETTSGELQPETENPTLFSSEQLPTGSILQ